MGRSKSWGISWLGDDKVLVQESETSHSSGIFGRSTKSKSNSRTIHMDYERFEYELERIQNNKRFSEDFSTDTYYRRENGENHTELVNGREKPDFYK